MDGMKRREGEGAACGMGLEEEEFWRDPLSSFVRGQRTVRLISRLGEEERRALVSPEGGVGGVALHRQNKRDFADVESEKGFFYGRTEEKNGRCDLFPAKKSAWTYVVVIERGGRRAGTEGGGVMKNKLSPCLPTSGTAVTGAAAAAAAAAIHPIIYPAAPPTHIVMSQPTTFIQRPSITRTSLVAHLFYPPVDLRGRGEARRVGKQRSLLYRGTLCEDTQLLSYVPDEDGACAKESCG